MPDEPVSPGPVPPRKQGRCPRCGKTFEYVGVAAHKLFPFCSARCKDIDLGNWFAERYVVPGQPAPSSEEEEPPRE
jgi:hypothetical protein